ncbi:MAG: HAD-IIIA family hydrolase [Synergistaceae bacterium]|jgi:3-deoxy-D-manno-octulosonate 8-phosphate phosphatase (KDO 8-P phosphatase)|nr:HAD-IIIA family hydrolase [Synergistaceae bacterium]
MIRLAAMDVDGTLTDGGIYMDGSGGEFKKFHVRDGYGIAKMLHLGIEVAFISGRYSKATDRRAEELGVTRVFNGTADKLAGLASIADEIGARPSEVAFIGDDIQDIPCMEWSGLGVAVGDAADEVKAAADIVTAASGGAGAVREAAEHIIRYNMPGGVK